ncbi:neuroblastoma-amplified sequence-like [Aphis craccivora]|uniref:Neuroblastoma-amplified sequence-like n=1 Tax=Aphis craccivora TaxID=307492 RepID=A0A6G0VS75_APHCR|nr:neuroblastoma-amplified sequence-like [Aphis craccivora]
MIKIRNWLLFLYLEKTYILSHYIVNLNQPNKTNLCIHENGCLNKNCCTCQTFVKIVKNCKYLVIEMCHNLKWKDHIQYITNKLRKLMHAFKILTDILELKTIRVVYQA